VIRGTALFMRSKSLKAVLERVPPPVFFFACLLLGWALNFNWPLSLGLKALPVRLALALPLFLLALLIGLSAFYTFWRGRTSPMPFGTPAALLTSGPFRLSRNPLYVAVIIFLTAFSLLLDSAWVLATVSVLGLALGHFIIPGEEARLRQVFGDRYTTYSGRVRRWL
jgi:protein-S-isoprenylcysteine O-methyltransferase Ste14